MNITVYNKSTATIWQHEIDELTKQLKSAQEQEQKEEGRQEQINSLQAKIGNCNNFLQDLKKNPQTLVNELHKDIFNKLSMYEKNYSEGKSLPIEIRICLYRLADKLNFATQSTEKVLPGKAIEIQYLKLCALIQDMYSEVIKEKSNEQSNSDFIKLLENLLESTHIDIGGDLPDEMRIGQTTNDYIQELKRDAELFPNASQLTAHEKKHRTGAFKVTSPTRGGDGSARSSNDAQSPERGDYSVLKARSPISANDSARLFSSDAHSAEQRDSKGAGKAGSIAPKKRDSKSASRASSVAPNKRDSKGAGRASGNDLSAGIQASPIPPKLFSKDEQLEEEYHQLLNKLQRQIGDKNTLLQSKINYAVEAVGAEVKVKKNKQEVINYHFYNQLLTNLCDLSKVSASPGRDGNDPAIDRFLQLAKDIVDTPSRAEELHSKKLTGAILAVIGVLLIAASIAILAATFGGSSLVSSVGVALGISLSSSQIVLSTTAGMTALTGAGLTFWGIRKNEEGQGRKLSKAISEVQDELHQVSPLLQ